MFPDIQYFVAPDDATAAAVARRDRGPSSSVRPRRTRRSPFGRPGSGRADPGTAWPSAALCVEPAVKLARLESVLTARPYEQVVEDPRSCALLGSRNLHRVVVVSTTDSLLAALADLDDGHLTSAASMWSTTEEMVLDRIDAETARHLLLRLRALAREARDHDHHLYCWIST